MLTREEVKEILLKYYIEIKEGKYRFKSEGASSSIRGNKDFHKTIIYYTSFLKEPVFISERIFCILYDMIQLELHFCKTCNNEVYFNNLKNGYRDFCSVKCMSNNTKIKKQREDTCFNKYGVYHSLQNKEIREKTKETLIRLYGVDNISKSEDIKKRKKETCKKNYGYESPLQNKIIKEKLEKTCLIKYGCKSPLGNKEEIKKREQNYKKKYGVTNCTQNPKVQKKSKTTNLKKYGCISPMGNKEVRYKRELSLFKKYGNIHYNKDKNIQKIKKENIIKKYGSLENFNKINNDKRKQTYFEKTGYYHNTHNPESSNIKVKSHMYEETSLYYQSSNEKEFLSLWLEFYPIDTIKRCFSIPYKFQNKIRYYHPDFLITYPNNSQAIVEIKATHQYFYQELWSGKLFAKWDSIPPQYLYYFILNNEIYTKQDIIDNIMIPFFHKNYPYL